jgi:hypothetical protein
MTDDKELATMAAIAKALDDINDDATVARVLQWINSRYGKTRGLAPLNFGPEHEGSDETEFADLASLFNAAEPSTDPQRALVAGYWFQVHENKDNLDAQSINAALKNLGHPISNITSALTSLKDRKPSLVMQVQKTGKTAQARKKYRLTAAGIAAVRRMLHREA